MTSTAVTSRKAARRTKKDAELDPLEAAYFVPVSAIGQYTDAERLFGGNPRKYARGTFIYRLAGRAGKVRLLLHS